MPISLPRRLSNWIRTSPQARAQLGLVLVWRRQNDASIASFERAIALKSTFQRLAVCRSARPCGRTGAGTRSAGSIFKSIRSIRRQHCTTWGWPSCSKGILKLSFHYSTASPARRLGGLHARHLLPRMRTRDSSRAHGRKLGKYCASSPTIRSKSIGAGPHSSLQKMPNITLMVCAGRAFRTGRALARNLSAVSK